MIGDTDLAKVDAHAIQSEEYDEIPELTDEMIARADLVVGGKIVRRGRRRTGLDAPERQEMILQEMILLDADVIERFRASGPDWQERINEVLRRSLG